MKRFMLLVEYCGECTAHFGETYEEIVSFAFDCECGIGASWQLYEWNKENCCYEFLQS